MLLPAFALGFSSAGLLARLVRSSMLDVLREDYVRTAFAKGLAGCAVVVVRHALRNALIPALTVIGTSVGALLGGAVVTETVFTIPGMGRLVVQSIARRDYPVIQGAVMVIAMTYVFVNLIVDRALCLHRSPRPARRRLMAQSTFATAAAARSAAPSRTRRARRRSAWLRAMTGNPVTRRRPRVILAIIALAAIFAPLLTSHDPTFLDPGRAAHGPSTDFFFGTDDRGRDVFTPGDLRRAQSLVIGISVTLAHRADRLGARSALRLLRAARHAGSCGPWTA